jgi:heat-inducible transcriptional repressor
LTLTAAADHIQRLDASGKRMSNRAATDLTDREEQILEAVIRTYVETAEPAGSRTVAKRHGLGVSPATIRNAMSDLEDKGFLFHPHTSAGRIPTDLAYRYYVDTLMRPVRIPAAEQRRLRRELEEGGLGPLDRLIRRSIQVLGLVTGELGIAIAPRLDEVVLEKLELALVSAEKILLVLTLRSGVVRTVYVDVSASVPAAALAAVNGILNERLAGRSLSQIRATLPDRLRDAGADDSAAELLNIFMQSAEDVLCDGDALSADLLLGRTSVLANQPEFSSGPRLRSLLELTEQKELLTDVLASREHDSAPKITIGGEHGEPKLRTLTLVTSEYRLGNVSGVLGVIGPTRMPYEKVAAIVEYTSNLMSELASAHSPDANA